MGDKKTVFNKVKDIHYKMGGERPKVAIGRVAEELQLTSDEVTEHLTSLKNLRLVKFTDAVPAAIEMTKIGLSTKVG